MKFMKLTTFLAATASFVDADPGGVRSADDRSLDGVGAKAVSGFVLEDSYSDDEASFGITCHGNGVTGPTKDNYDACWDVGFVDWLTTAAACQLSCQEKKGCNTWGYNFDRNNKRCHLCSLDKPRTDRSTERDCTGKCSLWGTGGAVEYEAVDYEPWVPTSDAQLGQAINDTQNVIGQAIVDAQNAISQQIVDSRNTMSNQHNQIVSYIGSLFKPNGTKVDAPNGTKVDAMQGKVDALSSSMHGKVDIVEGKVDHVEGKVDAVQDELKEVKVMISKLMEMMAKE